VHYRKNSGVSSEVTPVSTATLWIWLTTASSSWKQWLTISTYMHRVTILIGDTSLETPIFFM
jgi:hypothetical protein